MVAVDPSGEILFDVTGQVATITFNRPERKNAYSRGLMAEFIESLKAIRQNDKIRCIVTTGAGDSFAGGFMGWLARSDDLSEANMRRAVVVGSAMCSFVVENFSITRLLELTRFDIEARVGAFHQLVSFDKALDA